MPGTQQYNTLVTVKRYAGIMKWAVYRTSYARYTVSSGCAGIMKRGVDRKSYDRYTVSSVCAGIMKRGVYCKSWRLCDFIKQEHCRNLADITADQFLYTLQNNEKGGPIQPAFPVKQNQFYCTRPTLHRHCLYNVSSRTIFSRFLEMNKRTNTGRVQITVLCPRRAYSILSDKQIMDSVS